MFQMAPMVWTSIFLLTVFCLFCVVLSLYYFNKLQDLICKNSSVLLTTRSKDFQMSI